MPDQCVFGGAMFLPPGSSAIHDVKNLLRFKNPEYAMAAHLRANGKRIPLPSQWVYRCYTIPAGHPWAGGIMAPRHIDLSHLGLEVVDRTTFPAAEAVVTADGFKLRDYQKEPVDLLENFKSGYVVAPCVAGDTIVNVNRGGKAFKIRIDAMFKAIDSGGWDPTIQTRVRSLKGDRVGLNNVIGVFRRGVKETITIRLHDGKSLRLTRNHLVMTPSGWVEAGSLSVGDLVLVDSGQDKWGKKADHERSKAPRIRYKRLSWSATHPYAHKNGSRATSQSVFVIEEHRAVAEAAMNGLTLDEYRDRFRRGDIKGFRFINPATHHVHHINMDHKDNRPENLVVLTVQEHLAIHGSSAHFGYGQPMAVAITEIAPGDTEEVYDIACDAPHNNFVANGIIVHNCGAGKTSVGMGAIARIQTKALVLVHSNDLAEQWCGRVAAQLRMEDGSAVTTSIVGDGKFDDSGRVVVALFQTLLRMDFSKRYEWAKQFGLVIADECFVAGTPIDMADGSKKLIEDIAVGDLVLAYDEKNDRFASRKVNRLFHNKTSSERVLMVGIGAGGETKIFCTENHPFWVLRDGAASWRIADDLEHGDRVLSATGEWVDYAFTASSFAEAPQDVSVYNFEVDELHTYVAGGVVVHNCHHVPAETFNQVMCCMPAKYRLGLTATPERADNLQDVLDYQMGIKLKEIRIADLAARQQVVLPRVRFLRTNFTPSSDRLEWAGLISEMCNDKARNDIILSEVKDLVAEGRQVLVLSDRVEHCKDLAIALRLAGVEAAALVGEMSSSNRKDTLEKADKGFYRVVTATSLADEGLDLPGLEAVVLTSPSKAMGRIQQRVGRVMRPKMGKKDPVVVDLIDRGGAFEGLAKKRARLYRSLGCLF